MLTILQAHHEDLHDVLSELELDQLRFNSLVRLFFSAIVAKADCPSEYSGAKKITKDEAFHLALGFEWNRYSIRGFAINRAIWRARML
jgi:hypothetical protein